MMPMLAQADMNAVPPGFIKNLALLTVGAAVAASFILCAVFAALNYFLDRRRADREEHPLPTQIEPNPLQIQKIFPNATLRDLDEKYSDNQRRLSAIDEQLGKLWTTMREEDKEIRSDLAAKFEIISRALGRIEGKLEK